VTDASNCAAAVAHFFAGCEDNMSNDKEYEEWAMIGAKGGVDATCDKPNAEKFLFRNSFFRPDGVEAFLYTGPTDGFKYYMKKSGNYIYRIEPKLSCLSIGKTVYIDVNFDVIVDPPSTFKNVIGAQDEPARPTLDISLLDANETILPGAYIGTTHMRFKLNHGWVYRGERKSFSQSWRKDFTFTWSDVKTVLVKSVAPVRVMCTA
jgi:hypothetical protein